MAGTMTFTYDDEGAIKKILVSWTSDSSGDATGTTKKIIGSLLKGVTDPDGTDAPTDNYDITIKDATHKVDVLGECQDDLVDRDTANNEAVHFFLLNYDSTPVGVAAFPVVADQLDIAVAAAGNAKKGQIIIYYRSA